MIALIDSTDQKFGMCFNFNDNDERLDENEINHVASMFIASLAFSIIACVVSIELFKLGCLSTMAISLGIFILCALLEVFIDVKLDEQDAHNHKYQSRKKDLDQLAQIFNIIVKIEQKDDHDSTYYLLSDFVDIEASSKSKIVIHLPHFKDDRYLFEYIMSDDIEYDEDVKKAIERLALKHVPESYLDDFVRSVHEFDTHECAVVEILKEEMYTSSEDVNEFVRSTIDASEALKQKQAVDQTIKVQEEMDRIKDSVLEKRKDTPMQRQIQRHLNALKHEQE